MLIHPSLSARDTPRSGNMICNPYEIIIQGITSEGRTFRPSDWAERLSGILASLAPTRKCLTTAMSVR